MAASTERSAFRVLHAVLGLGLFGTGVDTLIRSLRDGQTPLALVAIVTSTAAVLFLIPRTVRAGGALLLLVVLTVLAQQTIRGAWRLDLMVFAAAIWLVVARGGAWGPAAAAAPGP